MSNEETYLREEPRADDAEQAVLGICLTSEKASGDAVRSLAAEDFYQPAHQAVFRAVEKLSNARESTDPVAVWNQVLANGEEKMVSDGIVFLHQLITVAPPHAALGHHVQLVKDAGARRQLARLGLMSQNLAGNKAAGSAIEIMETLRAKLESISASVVDDAIPNLESSLEEALSEVEKLGEGRAVVGIPTGFPEIDSKLHGLRPGQMIIIAGRPGMGKSTIALDVVRTASFQHNKSVLLFSLEMSRLEVVMKLLSAQARVELANLQSGKLSDEEWERIAKTHAKINKSTLGIDDTPNLTVSDIRTKARNWQNKFGLDMIVVDYLQLMSSPRQTDNRQQEVSEMSRNIKLIAKEFGVPVIALSQLNRGAEQRTDKRPMVSDLRESGCLTGDTKLLRSDTGKFITFDELIANGFDNIEVWSVDRDHYMVSSKVTNVFSSGVKNVFKLVLSSGREVKTSGNHKFLTSNDEWAALEDLSVGDEIALPKIIPSPLTVFPDSISDFSQFVDENKVREEVLSLSLPNVVSFLSYYLQHHCSVNETEDMVIFETLNRDNADVVSTLLNRLGLISEIVETGAEKDCNVVLYEGYAKLFLETVADTVTDTVEPHRVLEGINDIFWDEIVGIEDLGEMNVYDATVEGTHNFIANGVVAHNSLEQDADVVILIHREEVYNPEVRVGEADVIIGKQRSGPTGTVPVVAQLHYSRFVPAAYPSVPSEGGNS